MLVRYRKAIVFVVLFCLFSCTSCGVKQNTDKQEVKKKITWEGDYPYANSTDIEFVKSKFPNIEEIKSVSYIYEKKSNDREIGLEWIHFEGIINIGKNFSEKIAREYDWEPCDTIPNLSIKTKNTDYMYCEEFTDDYTSDSFVGEFYFVPSSKQLIFYGEY